MPDLGEPLNTALRRVGGLSHMPAEKVTQALEELPPEYTYGEVIGVGGLGLVLRAQHRASLQLRAMKITLMTERLPGGYSEHLDALLTALPQPAGNVLLPIEVIHGQAAVYEIYPYLEKVTTVEHELATRGFTPAEALHVAAQSAAGLCLLHKAGMLHADVKPQNLLIRRDPLLQVFLTDLGWVRPVSDREAVVVGTLRYMHPELISGSDRESATNRISLVAKIGPWIDLYSLGVVILELFDLELPGAPNRCDLPDIERAVQVAGFLEPSVARSFAKLLHDLLSARDSTPVEMACTAAEELHRLGTLAGERSYRHTESAEPTQPERPAAETGLADLRHIAEQLSALTAAFVVRPEGASSLAPPATLARHVDVVFREMRLRNRQTFMVAATTATMTTASFVLTLGLIVAAVLAGVFTDKAGWAVAFGSAGAVGAIGTYLWKPFDRMYRANILSNQIEFISARTVAILERTQVLEDQKRVFDEAIRELGVLFERHSSNGPLSPSRPEA